MKKYQQLAQQLTEQIALGVWLPGDRLPSLREQVISSGMSFMTVSHAYQLLESQGRIVARPQSGYYVAPQPVKLRQPAPPAQVTRDEAVDINTYIFEVLQASRQASMLPFASAFPDPRLFPLQQLNRSLAQVSKTATAMSVIENLPPGNAELRHAIARRYALQGMNVSPDEIVITAGALEALNLSLQAVTEPGDWVVVENPCFYGALQALERLRLKALSVATDVREGIDLTALEAALQKAVTGEVLGSPGDDAALQLVLKMSGTRLSYRLGGGRQTGAADPAAPADEYAFHQFADAVSPGGLPVHQAL